jgi:hypothetical protein
MSTTVIFVVGLLVTTLVGIYVALIFRLARGDARRQ